MLDIKNSRIEVIIESPTELISLLTKFRDVCKEQHQNVSRKYIESNKQDVVESFYTSKSGEKFTFKWFPKYDGLKLVNL